MRIGRTLMMVAFCMSTPVMAATVQDAAVENRRDELHQRGMSLLTEVLAESRMYEAPTHASALFLAGHTMQSNPALARDIWVSAYSVVQSPEKDELAGMAGLKAEIVRRTTAIAPQFVAESLPQNPVLRDVAVAALVTDAMRRKEFERAIELAATIETEPELYVAAAEVLSALPAKGADFRARAFGNVLTTYRRTTHPLLTPAHPADFGNLIARFWEDLPSALVREAIAEVLRQASPENLPEKSQALRETLTSDSSAGLRVLTIYQFRLAQFLPILKVLDPAKAEELAKKHAELQLPAEFPEHAEVPKGVGATPGTLAVTRDGAEAASAATRMYYRRIIEEVTSQAESDPRAAIAKARAIDQPDVRVRALMAIATLYVNRDRSITSSALAEVAATAEKSGKLSLTSAIEAAAMAAKTGDFDGSISFLQRGFKAAEAAYAQDSDRENPNRALRLFWPSTHAWRDLLEVAYQISPEHSLKLLGSIPDGEVRTLAKAMLAASFLDVPVWRSTSPMVSKKTR